MRETIRKTIEAALYPTGYRCLLCNMETDVGEDGLCAACRKELRLPKNRKLPLITGEIVSSFSYEGAARDAMHRFKYEKQWWLAPFFTRNIAVENPEGFDCVIPVPMHPVKRYFRGCNPAELIAIALTERYPLPPVRTDLLRRTRLTVSQTKKGREERRLSDTLYRASQEIAGLRVLLVDDVVTTGATLSACAAACLAAGALSVSAVCGASSEKHKERRNEEKPV
ncbi:MAG: phosphoribosyltransferase family protein [Clostridia bacterium]|nr:phosphoribosyltransferase family protein [Clostridia bacterium]